MRVSCVENSRSYASVAHTVKFLNSDLVSVRMLELARTSVNSLRCDESGAMSRLLPCDLSCLELQHLCLGAAEVLRNRRRDGVRCVSHRRVTYFAVA